MNEYPKYIPHPWRVDQDGHPLYRIADNEEQEKVIHQGFKRDKPPSTEKEAKE